MVTANYPHDLSYHIPRIWGFPEIEVPPVLILISRWDFPEINHPAIRDYWVSPWLWKPPHDHHYHPIMYPIIPI